MSTGSHLNQIIDCIQEHQQQLPPKPQTQDLALLHNHTISLLGQFNGHLERCKRYNQARIHHKYQNLVERLQVQNRQLRMKLQLQRQARPSSQGYVSDLLDRMVQMREFNELLRKENQELRNTISNLNPGLQIEVKRQQPKQCSQQQQRKIVKEAVSRLKFQRKEEVSLNIPNQLHKFLQINKEKIEYWTFFDLLKNLQKWLTFRRENKTIDSERIRINLQRTISSLQRSFSGQRQTSFVKFKDFTQIERSQSRNTNITPKMVLLRRKRLEDTNINLTPIRRQLAAKSYKTLNNN